MDNVALVIGVVTLIAVAFMYCIDKITVEPNLMPGSRIRVAGRTFYVDSIEIHLGEAYATARVNAVDQVPEEPTDDPTPAVNYWELGPYTVIGDEILRNV